MLTGIDISTWQQPHDYAELANAIDFAILKAGGSNTGRRYTDARYARHADGLAHRVPVGAYWMNGAGPVAEDADYFLSILREDTRAAVVLDIETIDGYQHWSPDDALEFFGRLQAGGVTAPLYAYMNSSVAAAVDWSPLERAGIRLWLANYGRDDGTLTSPNPSTGTWSGWAIHQYTQEGAVAGISGGVDLNRAHDDALEGDDMFTQDDRDKLTALANGALPTAKGYPFPARDAVQNNLEAIINSIRALSKSGGVDVGALGAAIADSIRPTVEAALQDVQAGATPAEIADEIARRLEA